MKKILFSISLFIGLSAASHAQINKSNLQVVNRFHLLGDGHWDYLSVDELSNIAYVSHGDVVQVIDLKDGHNIATISDLHGVHGVAIAHDLNKGFISNGKNSTVTIFDLGTNKTLAEVTVTGKNPDAIVYDRYSHKVFTFNGGSSDATVIDAKTNTVMTTIPLDGKPEYAVTNEKGQIFVNIEDKSEISTIDTKQAKVLKSWSIAPGESPSGLAIDIKNNKLFSVCDNHLMSISDAVKGKTIAQIAIGSDPDGVAFDPSLQQAYSANGGDGTITIVQESKNKFKLLGNIPTQKGARTIAVNPKTHHLYLPVAEYEATKSKDSSHHHEVKAGTFTVLDVSAK